MQKSDFDLVFPKKSNTEFAFVMTAMFPLSACTMCLWFQTSDQGFLTLFSYAVGPAKDNALFGGIGSDGRLIIYVNNEYRNM